MLNIVKRNPTPAERRFVDEMVRFLVPWGVPQTAARLYGYLLLCDRPVSLDQIAADLEISKSGASVAARLLEMYTLARRHGQRASRRILYEASDNYEAMLAAQNRSLEAGADLLRAGAEGLAPGKVRERLEAMAEFYLATREAMESLLQRWRARKRT